MGTPRQELAIAHIVTEVPRELRAGLETEALKMVRAIVMVKPSEPTTWPALLSEYPHLIELEKAVTGERPRNSESGHWQGWESIKSRLQALINPNDWQKYNAAHDHLLRIYESRATRSGGMERARNQAVARRVNHQQRNTRR